ncbi:MAG: exo-alpha-sialidase, partial [Candidatus Eisenbacteria bacterium]|nr:exo-alpha-sialidase [Candidatus Eisenbacteria bacterium]
MSPEKPTPAAPLEQKPCLVRMPDRSVMAVMNITEDGTAHVVARRTFDDGRTWTDKEALFDLDPAPGGWGGGQALVDGNGDLHVFLVNDAGTGVIRKVSEGETRQTKLDIGELHLDVWHTKTMGNLHTWTAPKLLWEGWCGAFNTSIQLRGGRILLPFGARADRDWHHRGEGLDAFTFMGSFEIVVLYSDDLGETWSVAPEVLKLPTHTLHNYGADEPVLLERTDGSVRMLIRSQLGRLYES